MLKKLKKGLKKAAKVAVPVGAALLAARALKKRNARNAMMNSATSNDGFINAPKIMQMQDTPLITDDGFITRNNPLVEKAELKKAEALVEKNVQQLLESQYVVLVEL
jgi:CO/xanthine dehydrogenase Mo-binding subunit